MYSAWLEASALKKVIKPAKAVGFLFRIYLAAAGSNNRLPHYLVLYAIPRIRHNGL